MTSEEARMLCERCPVIVWWDMGDGRGVSCIEVYVPWMCAEVQT